MIFPDEVEVRHLERSVKPEVIDAQLRKPWVEGEERLIDIVATSNIVNIAL